MFATSIATIGRNPSVQPRITGIMWIGFALVEAIGKLGREGETALPAPLRIRCEECQFYKESGATDGDNGASGSAESGDDEIDEGVAEVV